MKSSSKIKVRLGSVTCHSFLSLSRACAIVVVSHAGSTSLSTLIFLWPLSSFYLNLNLKYLTNLRLARIQFNKTSVLRPAFPTFALRHVSRNFDGVPHLVTIWMTTHPDPTTMEASRCFSIVSKEIHNLD